MILLDLRNYLAEHKRVTLTDMSHRFDITQEAACGMMEHWIKKGRVRELSPGTFCAGCEGCGPGIRKIYEWIA